MSKIRKGRVGRLAKLGGLAARLGGGAVGLAGKRITAGKDQALAALHQRTAEQLFETMAEMKGLPMKVGQILSFMDGVVPPEHQASYARLLSRLQVSAKPLPWADMREVLEAELGRPYTELFSSFDTDAIAAASIGQVYRARLGDRPVAVKIQYPDIATAVRSDLSNAGAMARAIHTIMPNVESRVMIQDFLDRIAEECDYEREADNMVGFGARWAEDPSVLIPAVERELCSERVLVSELCEGQTLADVVARADPERRSALGEILFRFVFRSLLTHGMFNADPHPGNFLFPAQADPPAVVFLDFGCVQYFDEDARLAMREVIEAILAGARGDELWTALAAALEFPEDTSAPLREIIEGYVLFCFEPVLAPQPFRYTRAYTSRLSELTFEAKMTVAKNLLRIGWREPKRHGLVMLSRILFGMNSLLASLEAEADWRALLQAA